MAQKRMIDKKISVSEQVANLPLEAQLIFTWSIPHADDLGLLPHSDRTLRAMVVPMMDISSELFSSLIKNILDQKLFVEFEYKGESYYRIQKFADHQTLKKDRKPHTYLPDIDSWEKAEDIGFHLEDIGNLSKEKRSKEKRREVKLDSNSPKEQASQFFSDLSLQEEVLTHLIETSGLEENYLRKQISDFINYWTEPTPSGKKQKWETQKTFEIRRRLAKWLNNSQEWNKGRGSPPNSSRVTVIT